MTVVRGGTVAVTARPAHRHGTLIDLPTAVVTAGIAAARDPSNAASRCCALRYVRLVARPSFFQLRKAQDAGIPLHLIAHEDTRW